MVDTSKVNFPPDPNPKTPKLKMPPGAWDTHFHVMGPPNVFPYAESRHYTPPAAPIEHYFAVAKVLGLERGCLVHPSVHGNKNFDITHDALKKSEGRLKGVIRADAEMEIPEMRKLHAAGIRGVRIDLMGKLGYKFDEKSFNTIVARCAEVRWIGFLHVDPNSLLQTAEVIRKMPITAVIENYAQMDARKGVDQPALKTLVDLAQEKHVWLKTASAYRMIFKGATYEQVKPIGKIVHAAAPDRTIWGTDWPHSDVYEPGKMPNDGDLVDTLLDFCPDEEVRRKLLVDNPKRLFDSN
jgi:predicted TIM-barrel fold metal-dependent hydrolase